MSIQIKRLCVCLLPIVLLSACDDKDSSSSMVNEVVTPPAPVNYSYQLTVTNLTYAQPMSPIAVALHNEEQFWEVGLPSSEALEIMAESGENSDLLAQEYVLSGASGAGMLMPGMSETIDVTLTDTMPTMFSVATMLVNTNDAFTGVNAMDIANLAVGESISLTTSSYDAGTEKNTEQAETIPGPAGGGEGLNAMRDDVDFVAMHPGVVSNEDGLTMSALTFDHRFDNPTLKVVIERTE